MQMTAFCWYVKRKKIPLPVFLVWLPNFFQEAICFHLSMEWTSLERQTHAHVQYTDRYDIITHNLLGRGKSMNLFADKMGQGLSKSSINRTVCIAYSVRLVSSSAGWVEYLTTYFSNQEPRPTHQVALCRRNNVLLSKKTGTNCCIALIAYTALTLPYTRVTTTDNGNAQTRGHCSGL